MGYRVILKFFRGLVLEPSRFSMGKTLAEPRPIIYLKMEEDLQRRPTSTWHETLRLSGLSGLSRSRLLNVERDLQFLATAHGPDPCVINYTQNRSTHRNYNAYNSKYRSCLRIHAIL
jgi:hypothetical protein